MSKSVSATAPRSMPEGTLALLFIQIVSTLSFSVLFSTLVLYMKGPLQLTPSMANSIMGVFVAFNYALHLLGGYWGGRLFSYRGLFCLGMLAQILGCFFLSMVTEEFLYYGLAAFLTGSGLNVTCVNCMLTQRFAPDDSRRERAFLWNYSGMNVGFFVGFSMSGYFQLSENYETLFLLSSIGNVFALGICLLNWKSLADHDTAFSRKSKIQQKKSFTAGTLFVMMMPFVLIRMLYSANMANYLILLTGGMMIMLIYFLARGQQSKDARQKIYAFGILMMAGIAFQMSYMLAPMGLTHFIDHNVQRQLGQLIIPPQWFQNINTVTIVVLGPLMGILLTKLRAKGVNVNIPAQFTLALVCIGLAFIILPIGIGQANAHGLVNSSWVVACYVLQSIGELMISPIGYAMIGYLAPASLQGIMMGMWMLTHGVGATLASYNSNMMTAGQSSADPLLTNAGYSQVFLALGLITLLAAFILMLMTPKLKRLMKNEEDETIAQGKLAAV